MNERTNEIISTLINDASLYRGFREYMRNNLAELGVDLEQVKDPAKLYEAGLPIQDLVLEFLGEKLMPQYVPDNALSSLYFNRIMSIFNSLEVEQLAANDILENVDPKEVFELVCIDEKVRKFADFDDAGDAYQLLTDRQSLRHLWDYISVEARKLGWQLRDIGCALVKVGEGEYEEVWVSEGSVPYLWERLYRII